MSNQAEFLFWNVPQLLNNLVEFLDIASLLEVSLVVPKAADLFSSRAHSLALAEKAVLDRLPPESFSAYCVTTESDLEAATLLKLATHFNPLQIRSVGIFKGTTGAAWRMILEAFCKMGTLEDDSAEKRGFQVSRYSKNYYESKLPISYYCWY